MSYMRRWKKTLVNFTVDEIENLQRKQDMYETEIRRQNTSRCIPFEVEWEQNEGAVEVC